MCGRYFIDDEMWREIRKICKQIDDAKLKVTVGDVIEIQFGTKTVKVEVLDIQDTTKKEEAKDLFRYL